MPSVTQPPMGYEKLMRAIKGGSLQAPPLAGDADAPPPQAGRTVFRVSLPRYALPQHAAATHSYRSTCARHHSRSAPSLSAPTPPLTFVSVPLCAARTRPSWTTCAGAAPVSRPPRATTRTFW